MTATTTGPDQVFADLRRVLADMLDLPAASITPESHLWDDLEVDSLSVLELAVFVEENYEVDLEPVLRQVSGPDSPERAGATVGWLTHRVVESADDVVAT